RYAFEALTLFERTGDRDGVATAIAELAHVATGRGDALRGARLASAAIAVWEQVGSPPVDAERERFDAWRERMRAALGDDFEAAWSEGSRMTAEQAASYARGEASELALL
ncbi:MAG TPA: hypothetical protein VGV67_01710, partial [Solirubrobacteraceae bacterium]|nr:hypothetical protein [Solirubrobacteraceae bacterium]